MKHSKPQATTARSAFTLVELLIVVAIIVILIAILIPSMEQAFTHAQIAACGSNQHQLTLASTSYAIGNKTILPGAACDRANNDPNYAANWLTNSRQIWVDVLAGYTPDSGHKVLFCPTMTNIFSLELTWPEKVYNEGYLSGYSYFGNYTPPSGDHQSWKGGLEIPRRLSDPGRTPVFSDVTRGRYRSKNGVVANPPTWVLISHMATGGSGYGAYPDGIVETETYKPKGINNGHLDGSAFWYSYDSKDGGQVEYAIQLGGNPGFLWGKQGGK